MSWILRAKVEFIGCGVYVAGSTVSDFGFRVSGFEFRAWCFVFWFRVPRLTFGILDSGFRVSGSRLRVSNLPLKNKRRKGKARG